MRRVLYREPVEGRTDDGAKFQSRGCRCTATKDSRETTNKCCIEGARIRTLETARSMADGRHRLAGSCSPTGSHASSTEIYTLLVARLALSSHDLHLRHPSW